MRKCIIVVILIAFSPGAVRAMAAEGLNTIASKFDPTEALNRLEAAIGAKGMALFARIDHAAGARDVGMSLRPTIVSVRRKQARH